MKTYAQIIDDEVYCIFESEQDVFPPRMECVDITEMSIQPKEGWAYDKKSKAFSDLYTVDFIKDERISKIKKLASDKILAIASEHKQRNMVVRNIELLNKKIDQTITGEELEEIEANQLIWNDINAIRSASNIIEGQVKKIKDKEGFVHHHIECNDTWPGVVLPEDDDI